MPSGKGQPSPAPSKRLNVSRTVEAAMPSRRAISRIEIPAENFKRMISRTWRIATLSAGIIAPLDCQRRDPKQASGGARRHSRPRAALFRSGGRHHLVMVGGIIPLRRATSSRYDGWLGQESALEKLGGVRSHIRTGLEPELPENCPFAGYFPGFGPVMEKCTRIGRIFSML